MTHRGQIRDEHHNSYVTGLLDLIMSNALDAREALGQNEIQPPLALECRSISMNGTPEPETGCVSGCIDWQM
jgi:hypothetical protein